MNYDADGLRIFIEPQVKRGRTANLAIEAPARISAHIYMRGFIGSYTYLRDGCRLGKGVRSIGRYCSIAPGAVLGDGQHVLDWLTTHPFVEGSNFWNPEEWAQEVSGRETAPKNLIVGNDVWIGTNAIVMRGLVIGDRAVIGAGAVVTKDVPPYAIVVGAPARILRYRFPQETIRRLLKLKWWQYTPASLKGVPFHDIKAAIVELERRKAEGSLQKIAHPLLRVGKGQEIWWIGEEESIKKSLSIYNKSNRKTNNSSFKDKNYPRKKKTLLEKLIGLMKIR